MNQAIYPAAWAEMNKKHAGEKYRPSNGTEGECFISVWCSTCQNDKHCGIVADTMLYAVTDEEYPSEWQVRDDGQPCCTAYCQVAE
ncbi:MAG: hypothetical protein E6Q97_29410 [Desulfurellales bacterium]|nr:MAG: hypothetical protein E6Q97_29410 [Desulfurellales bacterium]